MLLLFNKKIDVGAGNGMSVDLRGFKNLWTHGYGTLSGSFQVTKKGHIVPAFGACEFDGDVLISREFFILSFQCLLHSLIRTCMVECRAT